VTNQRGSGVTPDDDDDSAKPPKPRTLKRGAFPTPKSEIDEAKPYIPDQDDEDAARDEPDREANTDDEAKG
jgi:hypothetical protein